MLRFNNYLFTEDERRRFANWLEREAATEQGLITQMEKLGPSFAAVAALKTKEIAAMRLVLNKLRNTHIESL